MTARLHPAARAPSPLVFAHRGGCALGPENTIAAFDRGLDAGADGLELDVRLSKDGIVVVHHDPDLDRCTSGTGPLVAHTLEQLRALDAAHHFGVDEGYPLRGQGIGIPTLAEVLERYPTAPLIIELKTYSAAGARALVRTVQEAGAGGRVCIAAFDRATLHEVRRLDPALATSATPREVAVALYGSWVWLRPWRPRYQAVQVPETAGRVRVVSPRFVRVVHRADLPVQVWTVNGEADMWRLFEWGVDGLITDRPDLARAVRDRWVGRSAAAQQAMSQGRPGGDGSAG